MVKPESSPPTLTAETSSPFVPLDSSLRATPIHPDLAEIKVPGGPLPSYNYHPVTCEPIKPQDYPDELGQLQQEFTSKDAVLRAQERAAKEVQEIIENAQRKREDVQRAMDKKVKERDTEMKVVSKFQEAQAADTS
ncbi:hypothetical protein MYU51_007681 [Penicillium brevicompactum]|uniref:uncharacterized protein n=1 Tax=Penicillium brevicompactum TaxID=5074 RepID=UPI00254218D5|nr:uncharacterized protein N7506_005888 [Penicillium brevicompactum]KAJ5332105.1 hypothetical protein N7506_005888 [Penicillium brevicompactum]